MNLMVCIICGVVMLGLSSLSTSLQVSLTEHDTEAKEETRDATNTQPTTGAPLTPPHHTPCLLEDILATLRESLEENGALRPDSLAHFAVCTNNSFVFMQLAAQARNNDFSALHPTEVLLEKEMGKNVLTLNFDPPKAPQTMKNLFLLLFHENMIKSPGISFTSPRLDPSRQTPCSSEETKYILLTGKEEHCPQTWEIMMSQTASPDTEQHAVDGDTASIFALLLFSSKRGTDKSPQNNNDLSHNSFLCELRHFLVQSFPQTHDASVVSLEPLRSLPSQPIGLTSSESLLAGLINSSSPTILSFTQGFMLHAHHEELFLSPALVEVLGQRLERSLAHVLEMMKEDGRARGRLERLKKLSGFPFTHVEGKLQYRAFLLFKALQTASQALTLPRGQRSTRDHSARAPRSVCGLTSLSVSLQRFFIAPTMATINNCQGSCHFPMIRGSNHAVLLNSHIENGNANTRAPCCVPVAYDQLEVVKVEENQTSLETEPNTVATECECR